jgi:2-polyprenyl-3-methyl-5-hydroxy-6-metoxy-1,4-benzoquinol methylase
MDATKARAMRPSTTHDEQARQDFVSAFRAHLAARLTPGNQAAYERRALPRFERERGRPPADFHEVRAAMRGDPFYQFWSAMQRCSQERMWESVIEPAEREQQALVARARAQARRAAQGRGAGGSLKLDPALVVPRYHTAVDIHLQPGGYHRDFIEDDVAAGVIYDCALDIYLQGAAGDANQAMGDLLVSFLRSRQPDLRPARILDMGCGIGNSTLPWAQAFPDAQVHAIDVAAPVLRYGHARAEAMGARVHFSQQNAERTAFDAASFDLVVSHIMLHETSRSALPRIVAECRRLLRPGGLMLHLEVPRGSGPFQQFMYNWEVWNNNETFAVHMTGLDLAALATGAGFDPAGVEAAEHLQPRRREQRLYADEAKWKVLVARR